jgi:hypothetical protein
MKTLHLTSQQHELLVCIVDAIHSGVDARTVAQRTMERFDDVAPVGEGSEEEAIIWGQIHQVFDKVRLAPDRVYNEQDISQLWDRYFGVVPHTHEGPLNDDQQRRLRALIKEAPLKRKKDGSGFTEGYWIYNIRGHQQAVCISLHLSGESCMCDEELSDVKARI